MADSAAFSRSTVDKALRALGWGEKFSTALYVSGLVAIALGMAAAFVFAGYGLGTPAAVAAIAVAALIAERGGIRLTPTIEASTASLPFIFAGAVFGPLSAMLVGAKDCTRKDEWQ